MLKTELRTHIEAYLAEGDYSQSSQYTRRYLLLRFIDHEFSLEKDSVILKNLFLEKFNYLQGASFNFARATIKTFFDYLIQNRLYLDENPILLVKVKKRAKKTVDPFTSQEIEAILNRSPRSDRFMYELFLNTGVRLDELTNLKFKDFNSERKVLHVRARSLGGGAKGDKSRDIPLPDLLLKKYEAYLADYRLKKFSALNYVFVNHGGNKLPNSTIQSRLKRLTKKLGFRIHAHKFRATYATNLHKSGVSIYTISLLMGHEKIEATIRYIAVSEEEKRIAQRKGTYLGKKTEETKELERINREKEDLENQINELLRLNQKLLERVRRLDL